MAIVRNSFSPRLDGDSSAGTASKDNKEESCSSPESAGDGVFEDVASDADSGMGSDELDLSELGEPGTEICQVGNQSCSFPLDLYDVPNLGLVLSLETWNECLTEEERFTLAEYLPDLDEENFAITLKELFSGSNFHFCSPLTGFFNQLKTGLCDPRVVLYRHSLNIFQRRRHYYQLCEYHNSQIGNLIQIRDAWRKCPGYQIEERLQFLNILRSQRTLAYDRNRVFGSETDSEINGSAKACRTRRLDNGLGALPLSQKASFNALSDESRMPMEPVKSGKEKPKGMLKLVAPKFSSKKKCVRGSGTDWSNFLGRGADEYYSKGANHGMAGEDDWDSSHATTLAKPGFLKSKRKDVRMSSYLDCNRSDQAVTIASYDYSSLSRMKSLKQDEHGLKHSTKELLQCKVPNGSPVDWSAVKQPFQHGEAYKEAFSFDTGTSDGSSRGRKKLKSGDGCKSGKSRFGFDYKVSSLKAPLEKMVSHLHSDYRTKSVQGNMGASSHQGANMEYSVHGSNDSKSEETYSDSFERVEDCGNLTPYESKSLYPDAEIEVCQSEAGKLKEDHKRLSKQPRNNEKLSPPSVGRTSAETLPVPRYAKRAKKKLKTNETDYLDDGKQIRTGLVTNSSEKMWPTPVDSIAVEKKRNGNADLHHSLQSIDSFKHQRSISKETESLDVNARSIEIERQSKKSGYKISNDCALEIDHHEGSTIPTLGYGNLSKKQKCKGADVYSDKFDDQGRQQSSPMEIVEDSSTVRKKVKKKTDSVGVASFAVTPETVIQEKGLSDLEMDMKAHKKPFTLITPTIHTGFSFSIIHLLSAVRKALITERMEDTEVGKLGKDFASMLAKREQRLLPLSNNSPSCHPDDHLEGFIPEFGGQRNLASLTVQEIVDRVRLNPGDPCILETPEPLQDLVRGVLKIFSSRTAPLGAKGWKALVLYEKSSKTWSWVGSIPSSSSDKDNAAEETSAETWGIPYKVLVKLVDAFANWLKSGQETLQQIGSLPAPPAMMPVLDDKERFRDLRAQKSLNTISSSSEEVKAYFQKEELLRYLIPDRAFQYTALDGRKSIVAPLRRGGGKPTSKARDHFMLKPDRPPHVTILCLVRDAAARLPGSIGTRADVCTLIRDSQYIVEDVTDAQVNQVVSGALDRLHYERDPCVQFDGDRKLWVYLHRDRDEEDFEDDGTSSTKKWKRQRKDVTDPSEMAAMNDSDYAAAGETAAVGHSECDFNPNHKIDLSAVNREHKGELAYSDLWPKKENIQSYAGPVHCDRAQHSPITWGVLGGYPFQENKMFCQENTSQEFDDEAFNRERSVGLSTASLF